MLNSNGQNNVKSFELLKEALTKEPILKHPDPHEEYILYTDASKYAWAGVLTQEYQYDKDSGKISINPYPANQNF